MLTQRSIHKRHRNRRFPLVDGMRIACNSTVQKPTDGFAATAGDKYMATRRAQGVNIDDQQDIAAMTDGSVTVSDSSVSETILLGDPVIDPISQAMGMPATEILPKSVWP